MTDCLKDNITSLKNTLLTHNILKFKKYFINSQHTTSLKNTLLTHNILQVLKNTLLTHNILQV